MLDIYEIKKKINEDEILYLNENQIYQYFNRAIAEFCEENSIHKDLDEIRSMISDLFNEYRGLGIIDKFLKDDQINEIMVNAYDKIFLEKNGQIIRSELHFESEKAYMRIIQKIVSDAGKEVNISNPIVDARMHDGSRVNIVLNPIALNSPSLTIRKFSEKTLTVEDLVSIGTLDYQLADFIANLVKAKYNIIIGGGTSSGKTTFLNAISEFIDSSERIVTIEDSRELKLIGKDNLISLETRQANNSNRGEISIKELIKNSLRMRPDRIIVGEVRADETLDMLQAMNTGHDGSLSTAHANSSKDMLSRLETMVLRASDDIPIEAVKRMINSSIEIIIQLKRINLLERKIVEISEVLQKEDGSTRVNPIYVYDYQEKNFVKLGEMENTEKLERISYGKHQG